MSAGDIAPGPFAAACLAALRARPEPVHWVSGNGERDIVQMLDGVCVCHGSPTSVDEIITALAFEGDLRALLADLGGPTYL